MDRVWLDGEKVWSAAMRCGLMVGRCGLQLRGSLGCDLMVRYGLWL